MMYPNEMRMHRVILVDDDETCNFINQKVVERMSIADEVVVLKNGKWALDFVTANYQEDLTEQHPHDVLLLDINMPIMNGFEFLDALSGTSFPDKLRIIILSSSKNDQDIAQASKHRIHGFLQKPLDNARLNEILERSCVL